MLGGRSLVIGNRTYGIEQKLVNELTSGLSQQDIIFQKELITVFEPFPLRRVYQERLINLYGNEEAEKAYKKMIEMNK